MLSVSGVNQVQSTFASDFAAGTPWTAQPAPAPGPPSPPDKPPYTQLQEPCISPAVNAQSGLPPRDPATMAAPPQGTQPPSAG